MELLMPYLKCFLVGGVICAVGQVFIDKTALTPAWLLTSLVVLGVVLGGFGVYQPLVDWAGAGATVPLTGLAHALREAVAKDGWLGVFKGGFTAGAAGVCAALVFGYLAALLFRPREK